MPSSKVAVFGVPTAAGGRAPGLERAPFALREAGLLGDLRATGARVVNLSDLSLFPYRDDPGHPQARNAEVVECAVRAAEAGRARPSSPSTGRSPGSTARKPTSAT